MARAAQLDGEALRILRSRTFAHVGLVDERGLPHVTPMWIDVDHRGRIVVNTAEGRKKARLLRVGAPVSFAASDPLDPYRYVAVRGRVAERTHEGAVDVIDALAKKYTGRERFNPPPGQERVTVVIEPEWVHVYGAG